MVTELQKRCIEEASHEKLKNDAYAMLMNEEYYQSEIKKLEEENKKLKSDLAYERTMLDNVRAEYKSSQNVIKKLKEDVDFYYKSAKQLREQVEKWEKDFIEGRIVEKD